MSSDRWLIDFDGVLSDTFGAQIAALNALFDTSYNREDFNLWDTSNTLPPDQNEFLWGEDCFLDEDFQRSCKPLKNASVTLFNLRGDKYVVSDRPVSLLDVTKQFVDNRFYDQFRDVIFTRNKHTKSDQDPTIHTKSRVAYYKRLNKVVEDSPFHSVALANRTFIDRVYLIDTPANREVTHDKIVRVYNWEAIRKIEGV